MRSRDPAAFRGKWRRASPEDLATIIYTSGTTGEPKGVMLTHGNFLHNLRSIPKAIDVGPCDMFLSVLPVWHSFERILDNFALSVGASLAYSKPVGKIMLADMAAVRPTVMASVPRIWEGVRSAIYRNVNEEGGIKKALFRFFVAVGQAHSTAAALVRGRTRSSRGAPSSWTSSSGSFPSSSCIPVRALGNVLVFGKIKARLGGRFRFTVSGGGALPAFVDKFFQAAGVLLLEGYGLTETTPVVSVRLQHHPVPGPIGPLSAELEDEAHRPRYRERGRPGEEGRHPSQGPERDEGLLQAAGQDRGSAPPRMDGWTPATSGCHLER